MIDQKIKLLFKQNRIFYITGAFIIFGLKYFYSRADCGDLVWILAPTARWVRILTGNTFEYAPDIGYINHDLRFIIASSCSGVQFMIISIATLIYSFVHRMSIHETDSRSPSCFKKGIFWIMASLALSYLFTILVNGFRIVLSIYLPIFLEKTGFSYQGWLTSDRLHTIIGTVTYFASLLVLYPIADDISLYFAGGSKAVPENACTAASKTIPASLLQKCMSPVFWYFFIVLGIPFLNRAYKNNRSQFKEYALLVTLICLAVFSLFILTCTIVQNLSKRCRQMKSK